METQKTTDNIQYRKEHGLTTIKTAENVVPVFKLFMLVSMFGKSAGTKREPKVYGSLGEFSNVEIDMIKLSFFDMKFLLALLKEIDSRLEVNSKLSSDAHLKIEFDKIYTRMGLNPVIYRSIEKRKRTHETLKRLVKISMQYGYDNKLYIFNIFSDIEIDNFNVKEGYSKSFETMGVNVSKKFIDSSRESTQKFIGMIEIPFLEKLGPVASNLYMYIMANTGFNFIPRSVLIDRLDLYSYADEKNQNLEIKRAFEKLQAEGVISNSKFVYDKVHKRQMSNVSFTYKKQSKLSTKEKSRESNTQAHSDYFAKRINQVNETIDSNKKFDMLEFLFDKDSK